jgi:hypothetical protein
MILAAMPLLSLRGSIRSPSFLLFLVFEGMAPDYYPGYIES